MFFILHIYFYDYDIRTNEIGKRRMFAAFQNKIIFLTMTIYYFFVLIIYLRKKWYKSSWSNCVFMRHKLFENFLISSLVSTIHSFNRDYRIHCRLPNCIEIFTNQQRFLTWRFFCFCFRPYSTSALRAWIRARHAKGRIDISSRRRRRQFPCREAEVSLS